MDARSGTLLRSVSLLNGLKANVKEVVELSIDEDIEGDLFEFAPPPGLEVRVIREQGG